MFNITRYHGIGLVPVAVDYIRQQFVSGSWMCIEQYPATIPNVLVDASGSEPEGGRRY